MRTQFTLFDILLIIGIMQGCITGLLLIMSKRNKRSNKFLGIAIIAFSFLSVKMLLHSLGWRQDTFWRYFPVGVELFIGPLMYFYMVSLVTPNFKFIKKNYWHFLPFFLSQGYSFYVFFITLPYEAILKKDSIAENVYFTIIKDTEDYLALVSIIIYLIASFFILKRYRNWLRNSISDNSYPNFNWLKNIFILSSVLGLFLLVNLTLDAFFNLKASIYLHWESYYIFISVLIYYLGFVGYMQPDYSIEINTDVIEKLNSVKRLKLSKEKEFEIKKMLEKALKDDKVFLNPTLSSKELANQLGVSQSNLSYVVNRVFKVSFRDLINENRIIEVKSKLINKEFEHISILGIALECGFNSEASFYRVFKKSTGISPKEYMIKNKRD